MSDLSIAPSLPTFVDYFANKELCSLARDLALFFNLTEFLEKNGEGHNTDIISAWFIQYQLSK